MAAHILERVVEFPGPHRSRIHVGTGARYRVLEALHRAPRPTLVVTHERVRAAHRDWCQQLIAMPNVELLDWPEGEAHKNWDNLYHMLTLFHERGLRRDGRILVWGGGVLGDMVGFAAAIYLRGIPCWQVPTTLIAQTDSAIGGKTAVDMPWGKNLVGAFYPAEEVFIDPDFLHTLPEPLMRDGMGEVVKYAILLGDPFFSWLEEHLDAVFRRQPEALQHAVHACVVYKLDRVVSDPRDFGQRRWLNLGHTVGHAVEAASDFRIPHGTAVLIGLLVETRLAMDVLGFPAEARDRVRRMVGLALSGSLPALPDSDSVLEAMRVDKKRLHASKGLVMALPQRPGEMRVVDPVPEDRVKAALHEVFRALTRETG